MVVHYCHVLRTLNMPTHSAHICAGPRDNALLPLPTFNCELQVNPLIEIFVAHSTPHRDVRAPLVRVVANEIREMRIQTVKGHEVWVWVRTVKAQFDVHASTW